MSKRRVGRPTIKGFKSIQSEIFVSSAVLVLVAVVLITFVSVQVTRTTIFNNSISYTNQIQDQMKQNLESYVNYMDNIAAMISESEDTHTFLFDKWVGQDVRDRMQEQFAIILRGRSDILNLGLLNGKDRVMINNENENVNSFVDLKKMTWYQNAVNAPGQSLISSSHVQHVVEGKRPWVITLSRGIQNKKNPKECGVFFVDLNYSVISELCEQNSLGEKGYVFILDQDGNIVYHPRQQQLYNELQNENVEAILDAEEDFVITGNGDNERIYTISRSAQTGWMIVGCVYAAELLGKSNDAQTIYIIVAIALVAITLLVSRLIAKSITTPIQQLRHSMELVQEGDFSAGDIESNVQNEVGSLTRSFRRMTHRIQELMEQNKKEQEEKRKSELRALQSQINPHFLYNTLDSIIWMAEGKKNEEVVLMTSSLARLLRRSITNEEEKVTIGEELEHAKNYLTIMKMRYKDKLEYEFEVEPSILNNGIVKLVLQPVIENAIYHGVKYKEGAGIVRIRGFRDGDDIVIEIADDGVGMSQETIKHIFERHKVDYHSNGVGVYNVQKRLQLHYGMDYGMTYQSVLGQGTTVVIRIPSGGDTYEPV